MTLEAHPVAALFPMMTADELTELAEDIRVRGLLHPIVLDFEGRVLDGRNRLAACERACVMPDFVDYQGDDPAGYALAANIQRRSLTKGQQAMIAAKAGVLLQDSLRVLERATGINKTRLGYAAVVLEHAPDWADRVIAGAVGLDAAYEQARANKLAKDSDVAKLERLRSDAPDLADKVTQGDLTLPGALAEHEERQRKRAEERRDARALLTRIVDLTAPPHMSEDFLDVWARQLGDDLDPDLISRTEQAGEVLFALVKRIRP